MSLEFFCYPRLNHPIFGVEYFKCSNEHTVEAFPHQKRRPFHAAFGPVPTEAYVSILLYKDSDTNLLYGLLQYYGEYVLAYPKAPGADELGRFGPAYARERVDKAGPNAARKILEWEKAYGNFYPNIIPAVERLLNRLEAADETDCLSRYLTAAAEHNKERSQLKASGCTCKCWVHPDPAFVTPTLTSAEYQALGKLFLTRHLHSAFKNFHDSWASFRRAYSEVCSKSSEAWRPKARDNNWASLARSIFTTRERIPLFTRNPEFWRESYRFPSTQEYRNLLLEEAGQPPQEQTIKNTSLIEEFDEKGTSEEKNELLL